MRLNQPCIERYSKRACFCSCRLPLDLSILTVFTELANHSAPDSYEQRAEHFEPGRRGCANWRREQGRAGAYRHNTSMSSITVIVLLVAVLHLASRGQLTTSIWCADHLDPWNTMRLRTDRPRRLAANLIDTLRALRLVRPNGRKIGVTTRRKAMGESLKCWIVFVSLLTDPTLPCKLSWVKQIAIWQFEEWADWTVGWLPFYKTVRGIAFTAFLCTRAAVSRTAVRYYSISGTS